MKKIPFWIFPILFGFALVTVWVRLSIIQSNYQIQQMDQAMRNVRLERSRLNLEISKMRAPQELKKIAQKKFSNLERPKSHQVVQLR